MTRTILTVAALAVAGSAHADLESDFAVGRSAAGQLKVEFNFGGIEPIANFIEDGGFNGDFTGWFSDEPGFANTDENEADEDFFQLDAGANISVEIVAVEGPFTVYDPSFDSIVGVGESFNLGSPDFDDHPWWTVDTTSALFDENDFDYDLTFRLVDSGSTGYANSEDITVTFTRVPAPGSAAVLGLAALAAVRRRR